MGSDNHLALALGTFARRLKSGVALDGEARRQLVDLLLRAMIALHGGQLATARLDTDPRALIALAVEIAREGGLSGPDLVAAFNDALEGC